MRYIIGIDLGTTNSCVAYVDSEDAKAQVLAFKIPQLVAEGRIEALATLPSACYLAAAHEWSKGTIDLPWEKNEATPSFIVGKMALVHGAKVPTRLVHSAKSWLCHPAANRRDKILPVAAADESARISPIEATARYLRHIRNAWNDAMARGNPEAEFDLQEIILTVPASFDEVARGLTVEAARIAGFVHMTLLEEPQAAFYSWIAQHEGMWEKSLAPGMLILVCDVGGGTTDFSLIEVVEKQGSLTFQRMAVGNHLLLGGDNMDAAVAHLIESKLAAEGHEITSLQHLQLIHEARQAKEALLQQSTDSYRVLLQGTGSSVVHGSLRIDLSRQELQQLLLDGFFSQHAWQEALQLKKAKGLRSMGLPYEDEPSITKHLARFLAECGSAGQPKKPDRVLFNGGTMKPALFQEAVLKALQGWFPDTAIALLPSYSLDLAVARGAAYYGKVRRGLGVKIGGGIARGHYIVLEGKDETGGQVQKALTLLPRGSEEGAEYEPSMTFLLTPNRPVSFQILTSHVRLHDAAGDLIPIDPQEMQFLPPIHTILRFGKKQSAEDSVEKIPVHLHIALTPIGTLDITLKSLKTEHRWRLEFQVRSASGQEDSLAALVKREADQTFHAGYLQKAEAVIQQTFGSERGALKAEKFMERLEEALEMPRREWPPSLMRPLVDSLLKVSASRQVSPEYAARWWNAVGFLLRPGFGYALDDFRIKELWKIILSDYKSVLSPEVQIQLWICYRRIAGGLNKGQQMQLANDLSSAILSKKNDRNKSEAYSYSEMIRALAAMELIETSIKIKQVKILIERIKSEKALQADFWALGRLGARHLLYGSLANVIPANVCQEWIEQLLSVKKEEESMIPLFIQLARKTAYKELNIKPAIIEKILARFSASPQHPHLKDLLLNDIDLTSQEKEQLFGDRLPPGLSLSTK